MYIKTNSTSEKKEAPRLSSTQLFDLYRRLDVNGDGELDMTEFIGVGKKLNFEDEDALVLAFREADTSASGKLDTHEFVNAYNILCDNKLSGKGGVSENYVRAVRYGIDKSVRPAKYVMHMYTGTTSEIDKFVDLLDDGTETTATSSKKQKKGFEGGGMDILVKMMVKDGEANDRHGSRLLWWIDVSAKQVLPGIIRTVMTTFGLPEDLETCFYNDFLTAERETRLRMGSGKVSKGSLKPEVKSLNFFVQNLWLFQRPLVREYGPWVDSLCSERLKSAVLYLSSRFSQFYLLARQQCKESKFALQRAEEQAVVSL